MCVLCCLHSHAVATWLPLTDKKHIPIRQVILFLGEDFRVGVPGKVGSCVTSSEMKKTYFVCLLFLCLCEDCGQSSFGTFKGLLEGSVLVFKDMWLYYLREGPHKDSSTSLSVCVYKTREGGVRKHLEVRKQTHTHTHMYITEFLSTCCWLCLTFDLLVTHSIVESGLVHILPPSGRPGIVLWCHKFEVELRGQRSTLCRVEGKIPTAAAPSAGHHWTLQHSVCITTDRQSNQNMKLYRTPTLWISCFIMRGYNYLN